VSFKTLGKGEWETTRIVRDAEEIRQLKLPPGKDMLALGGAILISSLRNPGLIDELQLMVSLLVLGGGKALFENVKGRHILILVRAKPLRSGKVSLICGAQSPMT
jgi:dihydrofolate reductase